MGLILTAVLKPEHGHVIQGEKAAPCILLPLQAIERAGNAANLLI